MNTRVFYYKFYEYRGLLLRGLTMTQPMLTQTTTHPEQTQCDPTSHLFHWYSFPTSQGLQCLFKPQLRPVLKPLPLTNVVNQVYGQLRLRKLFTTDWWQ